MEIGHSDYFEEQVLPLDLTLYKSGQGSGVRKGKIMAPYKFAWGTNIYFLFSSSNFSNMAW